MPAGLGLRAREASGVPRSTPVRRPKLKGSIGEGPNHSNFSDQSSVRIQEILLEFIRNLKESGMFNIFDNIWLEDLFEKSDMKMETWELKIAKSWNAAEKIYGEK